MGFTSSKEMSSDFEEWLSKNEFTHRQNWYIIALQFNGTEHFLYIYRKLTG